MRYLLIICLLTILYCPAAGAVDTAPAGTAALVNGAVITAADFRAELDRELRLRKKSEKEMDSIAAAMLKKVALDTLIDRELLYQESRHKGVNILPSAVEAEIGKLKRQYSSEEDYKSSLAKLGLTEDIIKAQIERGMAIRGYMESEFSSKTAVTDGEAKNYYNSHQDSFLQTGQSIEGRSKTILPFEAVRDRIIKELQRERMVNEVTLCLKRLRAAAKVEIHLIEE